MAEFIQFIFIGFLAVISQTTATTDCSDEKYACSDIFVAKKCHAVPRCAVGVWVDFVLQDPSSQCQTCSGFVSKAKSLMGNKFLQFEMKMMLMNTCPMIKDANLASECKDYVNNYFDDIITLVESNVDPQIVCATLNICKVKVMNTTVTPVQPEVVPHVRAARSTDNVKDDTKCILCEFILREVDSLISDNATEQEILSALEKVCSILPSSIRAECVNFIDTYGPTIFFLLSHELDPKYVCVMLGLCTQKQPLSAVGQTSEACGMCQNVVQYLDSFLVLNSTIEEIDHLLEKVCDMMPGDLPAECRDFVEMYGGAVVYMVAEQLDPKTICTMLGLCPGKVQLLHGTKHSAAEHWKAYPCNQGPVYWCRGTVTAKQCKALGYCKTRVWEE